MNSNQSVTIYISAAPDLMTEREAIAHMIAELPVTLPWHIVQTPVEAEPIDAEALLAADLYFLLMGDDIRAPVGFELLLAQRAGQAAIGFLKRGLAQTPAGQVFTRQAQIAWQPFVSVAMLRQQIQQIIIEHLLYDAVRYLLTPLELAQLKELLQTVPAPDQINEGEGAGHSAVLLSRERYMPSEGVIIED